MKANSMVMATFMAAALGVGGRGDKVVIRQPPYGRRNTKPQVPTKKERSAEESAAKLSAAEEKRARKAAKRIRASLGAGK
ncbi:MAG: hypothetical protein ACK5PF_09585 [bacterium]